MLDELARWLATRPEWLQEACLRLAESETLSGHDLDELYSSVAFENGLPDTAPCTLRTVGTTGFGSAAAPVPVAILGEIGPVAGVDKLAEQQRPLKFAISGLTLIYGGNGSGKSGYCRLAKALCKPLLAAPLRGDAFAESTSPGSVRVRYKHEGGEAQELIWVWDQVPPPELRRISVFDSRAGKRYLEDARSIEFLPYGLDLLRRVGKVLQALSERFAGAEATALSNLGLTTPRGYTRGSGHFELIARLEATSSSLPTEQELRAAAGWDEADEIALATAAVEANTDVHRILRSRQRLLDQVEAVSREVASLAISLNSVVLTELKALRSAAAEARTLAERSATDLFAREPLGPQLGSESWRQMLRYARDFATQAFPSAPDPKLASGPACVLCQQSLDEAASDRLARFNDYLNGRAAEDALNARDVFQNAARKFVELQLRTPEAVHQIASELEEVGGAGSVVAKQIRDFFENARARFNSLADAIRSNNLDQMEVFENDLTAFSFDDAMGILRLEIAQLQEEAADPTASNARKLKHAALADRKRFTNELDALIKRSKDVEVAWALGRCRGTCSTTAITTFASALRKKHVSPALGSALREELTALGLDHLPIRLAERGERGESKLHITLETKVDVPLRELLSEGEATALALAGFLAETHESGPQHAIVLDDPVNSHDHERMEKVASRLAELAQSRQVIIFTHNLFFHYALHSEASKRNLPVHCEYIASNFAGQAGLVDPSNAPWASMKVNSRLDAIQREINAMRPSYRGEEAQRPIVRGLYTRIRETWERLIEEVLFAGVVERFRLEVRTMNLRAAQVGEDDREAIEAGMTRSSIYSGHDRARGAPPGLPTMAEIERDVATLSAYAKTIQDRKKGLDKAKKFVALPEFL